MDSNQQSAYDMLSNALKGIGPSQDVPSDSQEKDPYDMLGKALSEMRATSPTTEPAPTETEMPVVERRPLGEGTIFDSAVLLNRSKEEYDRVPQLISDEFKRDFAHTAGELAKIVGSPYDIAKGLAQAFIGEVPTFMLGALNAVRHGLRENFTNPHSTLEDIYEAMGDGFSEAREFVNPALEQLEQSLEAPRFQLRRLDGGKITDYILGKPGYAQPGMVGEVLFSPATGISGVFGKVADSDVFKDYPNVRGGLKIVGDVTALFAMGKALHLPSAKAEYVGKLKSVSERAVEIKERQDVVDKIPDSNPAKKLELDMLEAEKVKLEAKAAELMEEMDFAKWVTEDLYSKGEKVKQIRQAKKNIADEVINKAMEKLPEADGGVESLIGKEKIEDYLADVRAKRDPRASLMIIENEFKNLKAKAVKEGDLERASELNREILEFEKNREWDRIGKLPKDEQDVAKEKFGKKYYPKEKKVVKFKKAKPLARDEVYIAEEGRYEVPELELDQSPFFQTREEAAKLKKGFDQIEGTESVEVFTQKLINDVNRYLHGDNNVNIEGVRNALSELAIKSEDFRYSFEADADYLPWKLTVDEAAEWARRADRDELRSKNKQSVTPEPLSNEADPGPALEEAIKLDLLGEEGGGVLTKEQMEAAVDEFFGKGGDVTLGMFVGFDQRMPGIVKDMIKGMGEGIRNLKLHRNEAIWRATGWWLGKDNKWRYELLPGHLRDNIDYNKFKELSERPDFNGLVYLGKLGDHYSNDALFKEVPELRNIMLKYDKRTKDSVYSPRSDIIFFGTEAFKNRKSFVEGFAHEAQHVINRYLGGPRGGSSKLELKDYLRDPGEVEARLAEYREYMDDYQNSEPPWVSLDKMLESEGIEKAAGTRLYSGIPIDELTKAVKSVTAASRKAYDEKKIKPGRSAKMLKESAVRGWIDRSGNIKRGLTKGYKDQGFEVVKAADLVKGSNARSALDFRQMKKEVYRGIRGDAQKLLDDIILTKRMVEISKTERGKKYKYPEGRTPDQSIKFLLDIARLAQKESINPADLARYGYKGIKNFKPEDMMKLIRRADSYFEYMRKYPDMMAEEGLITWREAEELKKHDYRRTELVDILDRPYTIKVGKGKSKQVWDSGVQPLAFGRYTDIYEPSSQIMALEWMNRVHGRIARNNAWKSLAKFASQFPDNGFARNPFRGDNIPYDWDRFFYKDKKGKKKYLYLSPEVSQAVMGKDGYAGIDLVKVDKAGVEIKVDEGLLNTVGKDPFHESIRAKKVEKGKERAVTRPPGWQSFKYRQNGFEKTINLSPTMAKEFLVSTPEVSSAMAKTIEWLSGTGVLKTFATGVNWGFAVKNLPRDIMHSWIATRVMENGKFKPLYSSHMPVFAGQMARVQSRVFLDAITRGKRYQDYINEGGGMEFLVHQGRLITKGKKPAGKMDALMNFLGYVGETTEVMTRLANREQAILREAKRRGITYEEASKIKEVTQNATHAARDYMDFGQGGGLAKAMDHAVPYLNAGIVGTRGLFRAARDNPAQFAWKMAQFGAIVTGAYAYGKLTKPEVMKDIPEETRNRYIVLPLPEQWGFEDQYGVKRSPYLKIPIDQSQQFFKRAFEAATDLYLGNEVDAGAVVKGLADSLTPIDTGSLPPRIDAVLGYLLNKNFWQMEDIERGETFSWPRSGMEGKAAGPGAPSQLAQDVGKYTGLGPKRLEYLVGRQIAAPNMFSIAALKGYENLMKDVPPDIAQKQLAQVITEMPVVKDVIGVTNPYSEYSARHKEFNEEVVFKKHIATRELDRLADGALFTGGVKRSEVIKFIASQKDRDERSRLRERWEFHQLTRDLPERSFWLSLLYKDPEVRAKGFDARWQDASEEERRQIMKEARIIMQAKGFFSDKFKQKLREIRMNP